MTTPIHSPPFGPAAGDLAKYAPSVKKRKTKEAKTEEATKEAKGLPKPDFTSKKKLDNRVTFRMPSSPSTPPRRISPATPHSTPPHQRMRSTIPPTPSRFKRTRLENKHPLFSNEIPSSYARLNTYFPEVKNLAIPSYKAISCYQAPDQPDRVIIEQGSSKDCGAAAAFMFLSDIKAQQPGKVELNEDFMEWAATAYLYNGEALFNGLSMVLDSSIPLQKEKIPTDDPLFYIQEKLQITGLPVITSITHKKVGGHWIVVDHISETDVFLRDPYTGKAYSAPKDEIEKFYKKHVPEDILFISE